MGIRQVPPSIKDPNLAGFLRELRAAIGGVSDQVTKLVQTRSSSSGGGTGPVDPGPVDPGPGGGGGDGYPPPAPTSLQAIPAAFSVTLVWTNPVIPDLQATEVWARRSFDAWNSTYEYLANAKVLVNGTVYRSKRAQYVNPTNNVVTLNKNFPPATSPDWWEATTLAPTDKSKVGESAGTSWIHDKLTPGETWAYWVRNRDIENLFSTYYPDDDVGVITTTLLDPGAYLDLLTNSITATQLYRDLGARINLIDGPDTLINSVNARAKQITTEFDNAISDIVDGTTDITVKTDTGYATLRALKKSTEDSSAAIGEINRVEANSTSANASRLYGVRADVYNQATGLTSKASLTQLDNAKSDIFGASVEQFTNLSAEFENKQAQINQINYVSSDSTSTAAKTIAALDATVNTGPDSLSGKILALNDVSATSTSANAKALFQVQASNDTKISVFFQTTKPPISPRVSGDLWYDTANGNKAYIWDTAVTGSDKWKVYRSSVKTYTGNAGGNTPSLGTTAAEPLYAGDLYIDTSTETVNGQSVPRNKTWRWSGTAWVDISNGTYNEAKANALITNFENAKIGYCTINGLTTDHDDQTACQNAGGVWHQGLPWASAVKQVSVSVPAACFINGTKSGYSSQAACEAAGGSWISASTAAIEQQFLAQQEVNGDLYNQYTVKIDQNGWVSGFGLASKMQSDGSVISDFGIRADRFWLAPPTSPTNPTGTPFLELADLGSRAVIRTATITNINYSANGTNPSGPTSFTVAYAVVPSGNLTANTGLVAYNPLAFTYQTGAATINPNKDTWVSLRYVRTSASGAESPYWNQSFAPVGVGNLAWKDYYSKATVYAYNVLPGVTSSNVGGLIILAIDTGIPSGAGAGYGVLATDTTKDSAKLVAEYLLPFVVTTTPRAYNGITIDPGVYINSAFIVDASITNAKIYGDIRSIDYNGEEAGGSGYGNAGWCINKLGRATFNNAVFRGDLVSSVSGSPTFDSAGNITSNGTAGWAITHAGNAVFNTVVVRDAGKNITNGALAKADGTVVDYLPNGGVWSDNNVAYRLVGWTYSTVTKADKEAAFVFSLSMQCPKLVHSVSLLVTHGSGPPYYSDGTEGYSLYYDYDGSSSAGDLEARTFSATITDKLFPKWDNTLYLEVYIRVRSGGTQAFRNVRLSVQEVYS